MQLSFSSRKLIACSCSRRPAQVCGVAPPLPEWSASAHAHAIMRSTSGHKPAACGYHLLIRFSDDPDEVHIAGLLKSVFNPASCAPAMHSVSNALLAAGAAQRTVLVRLDQHRADRDASGSDDAAEHRAGHARWCATFRTDYVVGDGCWLRHTILSKSSSGIATL